MAQGKDVGDSLIPLAGQLREFEMPRPMFTSSERSEWAAGFYNTRHSSLQTRTDLAKIIKSPNSQRTWWTRAAWSYPSCETRWWA